MAHILLNGFCRKTLYYLTTFDFSSNNGYQVVCSLVCTLRNVCMQVWNERRGWEITSKRRSRRAEDPIDLHCCQSGAVPGTNLSTDVSAINWRGRVCIVGNIRIWTNFCLPKSSRSWGLYPPTPALSPSFCGFFLVSISNVFSPSFFRIWISAIFS